jgi:hypothetical protein
MAMFFYTTKSSVSSWVKCPKVFGSKWLKPIVVGLNFETCFLDLAKGANGKSSDVGEVTFGRKEAFPKKSHGENITQIPVVGRDEKKAKVKQFSHHNLNHALRKNQPTSKAHEKETANQQNPQ